jgi:sugar lactone lactonase YvrE
MENRQSSKLALWLGAIALSFGLTACGGGSRPANSASPSGTSPSLVADTTTTIPTLTSTTFPIISNRANLEVSIIAGALGGEGYFNGTGSDARFNNIRSLAYEPSGNLLVADTFNYKIRRITPQGVVTDVANDINVFTLGIGTGGNIVASDIRRIFNIGVNGAKTLMAGSVDGEVDGAGAEAEVSVRGNLAVANDGTAYFASYYNTIRKVSPAGNVTTIAGTKYVAGNVDGVGRDALFDTPSDVVLSNDGSKLYVADIRNHRIRVVNLATNLVSHFAGSTSGIPGNADGTTVSATFSSPVGICITSSGTLLVLDSLSGIRSISSTGAVSTIAAPALQATTIGGIGRAVVNAPVALAVSADGLTVAFLEFASAITEVFTLNAGNVTSLAGRSQQIGTADGPGVNARFKQRLDRFTVLPDSSMVIADYPKIRRVNSAGVVGTDTQEAGLVFALASNSRGDVYYMSDVQLFKLSSNGVSTAIAGTSTRFLDPLRAGNASFSVDGTGEAARFLYPSAMVVATDGTVYVTERYSYRIRKVTPAGVVTTLAGSGVPGVADGMGIEAQFGETYSENLVLDSDGNIFTQRARTNGAPANGIRKITPAGLVTTVSNLVSCNSMTIDVADNLYCGSGQIITRVTPAGVETVLADTTNGDARLIRTGNVNPSFNAISYIKFIKETSNVLVFAVLDYYEQVVLMATVSK